MVEAPGHVRQMVEAPGHVRPSDRACYSDELVFRAPLVLSKAGDVREEFENQLRQYEAEESLKEDEEAARAEIIQIILAEGEQDKQQTDRKKPAMAEQLPRKRSREFNADNMSDSENEEPVKRVASRQRGIMVNGKLNANGTSRFSRALGGNSEETRSTSTPMENSQSRRAAGRSDSATKGPVTALGTNTPNILSSSENSRPNSAPDLTVDKQALPDGVPLDRCKIERSTSPDSNDSISEELNHFKPIMCSPCTPPKKLADGRLLSPRIIRSTPRNLLSPLHKAATTYEVSPHLLEKWGQILVDRHMETKGTVTLEGEECSGRLVPECDPTTGACRSRPLSRASAGPMDCSDFAEVPDSAAEEECEEAECSAGASPPGPPKENGSGTCPNSERQSLGRGGKKRGHKNACPSPQSRNSRKRHRKTKHAAAAATTAATATGPDKRIRLSPASLNNVAQSQQQEEEDRKMANRLQRKFDQERSSVNRRKGSKDSYPLRTKVISNAE
ncbi:E3 ubiquitin-protein ligase RNF169 [Amblyraja radiata]|uniref:E3 ubiquitin-protein ligase RNF169 n=1 Tax=Amblyraja radiata TaxID=386614 RepID=UPI001403972A|nr:E3 ubiquitin-protein ligase RNF169 [Amblyraja radiata]